MESTPAVLQLGAAATLAYVVARYGLGHTLPLFAVTVTVTSLGLTRDARPVRVAETALGIVLGIALADLLLLGIGRGWWQLFLVLVVTFAASRFLSPSLGFASAAGVQAVLVALFPATGGDELGRMADGAVGGVVALAATALLPRDPRRQALADAGRLFDEWDAALTGLATALRRADVPATEASLERLRGTQPLLDRWAVSLDSARAVARVSPFLRRHRAALAQHQRMLRGMDLASRSLRIIARRSHYLLRDGRPRPGLAELLDEIGGAVQQLRTALDDPARYDVARRDLLAVVPRLDPYRLSDDAGISEVMVLLLLRPLAVDLLAATGMPEDSARALLPVVDG
ncbi:FUSC family protein [Naasia sp. SYSU D00057]|uniref:FUSC family protein n=1 Tax=Naasia sp. SYSU D00057 TaxID=2817380 RepID=UPI0027DE7A8E|nr:FUSC family protein [Naasia sp. SYSU D00057]